MRNRLVEMVWSCETKRTRRFGKRCNGIGGSQETEGWGDQNEAGLCSKLLELWAEPCATRNAGERWCLHPPGDGSAPV